MMDWVTDDDVAWRAAEATPPAAAAMTQCVVTKHLRLAATSRGAPC